MDNCIILSAHFFSHFPTHNLRLAKQRHWKQNGLSFAFNVSCCQFGRKCAEQLLNDFNYRTGETRLELVESSRTINAVGLVY